MNDPPSLLVDLVTSVPQPLGLPIGRANLYRLRSTTSALGPSAS